MTITADELVRREVYHTASHLVSILAQSGVAYQPSHHFGPDIVDLSEQAVELASSIPDYEGAASDLDTWTNFEGVWVNEDGKPSYTSAQELIEGEGFEPYYREVYEHWIVSDWMADKLAAKGEKVDKDFAGLTIWARTTTGQAISIDHVIEQIVADLNRASA